MIKIIFIFILIFAPILAYSGGVQCSFTLNAQKVQTAGNTAFAAMKSALTEFINGTAWVDKNLQPFEQLQCNIILTLTAQTGEYDYKGSLQIQAQRPVYNASYNSVIFNAIDNDVEFRFAPSEPLDFSMMSHNANNLTPLIAYWVYMLLGFDGDTFAPLGGTDYFRTAERIVENAASAPQPGWTINSGSGRKNRYALVTALLNKRYEKIRRANYAYHRLGLDVMSNDFAEGRKNITLAVKDIQEVRREAPNNTIYPIVLFFDAKADELVNLFSEASAEEKNSMYMLLSQIDVINEPKYKRLKQ